MLYGEEKALQMARSTLWSNARKGSRENLNIVRRVNRRSATERLHKYRGARFSCAEEIYDDDEDNLTEYVGPHKMNFGEAIYDRRSSENVHPFMRWAKEVTKDVPVRERREYLLNLVPDTIAGRHAVSHCWFLRPEHFDYEELRRKRQEERDFRFACEYAEAVERLTKILHTGGHDRFNHILSKTSVFRRVYEDGRWRYKYETEDRRLLGLHDVEDFIRYFAKKRAGEQLNNALDAYDKERGRT